MIEKLGRYRHQFTIIAIVMAFVSAVVVAVLTEPLNTIIAPLLLNTSNNTAATQAIIALYPMFMWLGLLISLLMYVTPQR